MFVEGEITTPWEGVSPEPDALARRYSLRNQLRFGASPELIVLSAELAQQRWMSDEIFAELSFELEEDAELEPLDLGERLLNCGYLRVDRVEEPGTFTVRGGVVECFIPVVLYRFASIFLAMNWSRFSNFRSIRWHPAGV